MLSILVLLLSVVSYITVSGYPAPDSCWGTCATGSLDVVEVDSTTEGLVKELAVLERLWRSKEEGLLFQYKALDDTATYGNAHNTSHCNSTAWMYCPAIGDGHIKPLSVTASWYVGHKAGNILVFIDHVTLECSKVCISFSPPPCTPPLQCLNVEVRMEPSDLSGRRIRRRSVSGHSNWLQGTGQEKKKTTSAILASILIAASMLGIGIVAFGLCMKKPSHDGSGGQVPVTAQLTEAIVTEDSSNGQVREETALANDEQASEVPDNTIIPETSAEIRRETSSTEDDVHQDGQNQSGDRNRCIMLVSCSTQTDHPMSHDIMQVSCSTQTDHHPQISKKELSIWSLNKRITGSKASLATAASDNINDDVIVTDSVQRKFIPTCQF